MKPLKLKRKHRDKLLEMVKVLFPKFSYVNIEDYNGDGIYLIGLGYEDGDNIKEIYHWFEFCMTRLCYKIDHGDYVPQYKTSGKILDMHPVDYLYYRFKKQKL